MAALIGAHVSSYYFPVHVRQSTKLLLGTVTYYFMVVLLPLPLGVLSVLLSQSAGELLLLSEKGGYYSDAVTQASRATIVAAGAAWAMQLLGAAGRIDPLPLALVALILFTGDALTLPLVLAPNTREAPPQIVRTFLCEAGLLEATLYVIAILGTLAARQAAWGLALVLVPVWVVRSLGRRNKELQSNTQALLENMADAVDLRNPYTGGHSRRVTEYTAQILNSLGLHGPDVDLILSAARVHDIGKIGIPDSILLKTDKLSDEEWAVMATHAARGADLVRRYPDFARGAEIIRHHHESWDGIGYPDGLKGTEIPFGASVIAVADSFDAMTSDRPYRTGMACDRTASILHGGRGTQRDLSIVDAFLAAIADRLKHGAEECVPVSSFAALKPTGGAL